MNPDKEFKPMEPPNPRRVMSFKAVIVLTKHDGTEVSMKDMDAVLEQSGLAYAMPAGDAPIVISFHMPPREGPLNVPAAVLGEEQELAETEEAQAAKDRAERARGL